MIDNPCWLSSGGTTLVGKPGGTVDLGLRFRSVAIQNVSVGSRETATFCVL
jgi:hypothetical protein